VNPNPVHQVLSIRFHRQKGDLWRYPSGIPPLPPSADLREPWACPRWHRSAPL